MSFLPARKGRHRQRYEDGLRLVSGCIPYRVEKDFVDVQSCKVENRVLVLMISTPNRCDLVFPKGGWEDDETVSEAAHREALEEAGVKGTLSENPMGVWEFRSKSKEASCSLEGGCRGYMFSLEVTEEVDSWAEQFKYERKWLTPDDAFKLCRYDWMRDALHKFLKNGVKCREEALVLERQILGAGCCDEKPSTVQRLEESCNKSVVKV